jgi:hypothetical protein
MFENFSFGNMTWRREPVLWAALVVAVANVVAQIITGDIGFGQAAEAFAMLGFGFIARGQVTPVN